MKKTISIKPYNCKVHFAVVDIVEIEGRRISKKMKSGYDRSDGDTEGEMLGYMTDYFVTIAKKHLTYNTVGHELFHLASTICKDREIHDEEQMCWLAGFLHQEFMKFCKSKSYEVQ